MKKQPAISQTPDPAAISVEHRLTRLELLGGLNLLVGLIAVGVKWKEALALLTP